MCGRARESGGGDHHLEPIFWGQIETSVRNLLTFACPRGARSEWIIWQRKAPSSSNRRLSELCSGKSRLSITSRSECCHWKLAHRLRESGRDGARRGSNAGLGRCIRGPLLPTRRGAAVHDAARLCCRVSNRKRDREEQSTPFREPQSTKMKLQLLVGVKG